MYGSLDVRKFLWERDEGAMRSGSVPAPRSGEPTRISLEQVRRARLAVARGARSAEDCKQLLEMLGLAPDDENGDPPVSR